jgi:hypothetical protein
MIETLILTFSLKGRRAFERYLRYSLPLPIWERVRVRDI